jgi:hypothetical protein
MCVLTCAFGPKLRRTNQNLHPVLYGNCSQQMIGTGIATAVTELFGVGYLTSVTFYARYTAGCIATLAQIIP